MEKVEKEIGYKEVFTQKEYMKNLVANLISRLGDSVDAIAFSWLVYAITGKASWSAIIFAVNQLPSVVVQPFAGPLVEGMDKKKVMVVTDFIRGFVVVGLAVLYLLDLLNPWFLLAFTCINSTVEAFCMPASAAIIPKIIKEEYYTYGTALASMLSTIVQLVGIAAGGLIIGVLGVETAILIDGVTFFGSAIIRSFMKIKEDNLRKGKLEVKEYFTTLKEGALYIKKQPIIRNFCIIGVIVNAVLVPMNALQTPLITEVLGQGSELLSVFSISILAGMGLGSFLFPFVQKKMSTLAMTVMSGTAMGGGLIIYVVGKFLQQNVIAVYGITIFASVFFGVFTSIINAGLNVQIMKVVSPDYLARISAIFGACVCAASPITSFLVSGLSAYLSVSKIFVISGTVCIAIFIFIGVKRVRVEQ